MSTGCTGCTGSTCTNATIKWLPQPKPFSPSILKKLNLFFNIVYYLKIMPPVPSRKTFKYDLSSRVEG